MSVPKVSVIIPNYNHAAYLDKRIETVLNQTFSDFEVLIMDDCSPDGSRDIIDKYAVKDQRIRTLFNGQNSGSTFKQWNKGVREARGEYIWLAESDDYADIRFLEVLVEKLNHNPAAVIAYTQSYNINESDEILGTWNYHTDDLDSQKFGSDFMMPGVEYNLNYLIHKNTIPNASAALFRKEAYQKIGGADQTIKVSSDWRLWLKLLQQGNVVYVGNPLNYYRTHNNTVRSAALKKGVDVIETLQMIAFIFREIPLTNLKKKELIAKAENIANEWMSRVDLKKNGRSRKIFLILWQLSKPMALRILKRKAARLMKNNQTTTNIYSALSKIKKIIFKIAGKVNPNPTIPLVRHIQDFKVYHTLLRKKRGLEIGGPSRIFEQSNELPIYPVVGAVDGCNFSTNTVWEGEIKEGMSYIYDKGNRKGYQYICEASDLSMVSSGSYDFVLSSHSIEHIANPFKAITDWLRVLKKKGVLLMVVPHKSGTFDHQRQATPFSHLLDDYKNGTDEYDLTHLPEILDFHDLSMDLPAGTLTTFKERSLKNFENRCLHHHVFDTNLVLEIFTYFNIQVQAVDLVQPYHIIVIGRKSEKADNDFFLKKYKDSDPFKKAGIT